MQAKNSSGCESELQDWIQQAKDGVIAWSELGERILGLEGSSTALDRPDIDRGRRCGFGEVIFGQGKLPDTVVQIAHQLLRSGQSEVLVTRVDRKVLGHIVGDFPFSRYDATGRTLRLSQRKINSVNEKAGTVNGKDGSNSNDLAESYSVMNCPRSKVTVVTAGSTDLPVAREAMETLRWMGIDAALLTDVGVAGPFRLIPHLSMLRECRALVVCAGMEGALASVLGGLVGCPIVAVPTSVGYGANLAGVTTLLSMLSSCAAGVTVVNIDAGFKGGYVAGLIASRASAQ